MLEQLYVYGVHAIYLFLSLSPHSLSLFHPLSPSQDTYMHVHVYMYTLIMHIHVRTCIGLGIAVGGRIPGQFMRVSVCMCVYLLVVA